MKLTRISFFAAISLLALSSCRDRLVGPPNNTTVVNDTIAYWIFNGNLNDITGNGHNGIRQVAWFDTNRFGIANEAIAFPNGTDTVSVTNTTNLNFTDSSSFSISVWVRPIQGWSQNMQAGIKVGGLVCKGPQDQSNDTVPGYQLLLHGDVGEVKVTGMAQNVDLLGKIPIADGTWHLLTLVVSAHSSVSLYTDSILDGSVANNMLYPNIQNNGSLLMGCDPSLTKYFYGDLDDILILNYAVTAAYVQDRFHEGGWYEHHDTTTGTTSDTSSAQFVKATGSLFPIIYSVCFPDPQDGFACGIYGTVAYSHDSGMTWAKGNSGIEDDLFGVSYANSTTGVAVGGNAIPGGVIIRTTDGGQSWGQSASNPWWVHPTNSHVFRDVKFFSDGIHAVCVGADSSNKGMIMTSADAGITWSLATTTPHALYSIALSNLTGNSGYAVVVGDSGGDFNTTDMGVTWENNSNATTNFNLGTTNFRQVSLDPGTTQDFSGTAISLDNATFWSTDMGRSWIERSFSGVGALLAVYALTGGQQAWVATEYAPPGGLYLTTDEGNTWTNEMPSSIHGETWSCIAARDAHHIAFIAQGGDVYWLTH